ncbi:hypothetical protein ONS95_012884 [Cadophora gregata]|uniref:uncharacterized protein n=1 Tax=Cadophora gregata TaxID=51156 RepID=UPI0026DBB575|nr:uncharacterized protein ONS95_012884 [Cadophora gregata]KAK0115833.1 hypothetical protein ONS95_012884 [Cadophora gregata]
MTTHCRSPCQRQREAFLLARPSAKEREVWTCFWRYLCTHLNRCFYVGQPVLNNLIQLSIAMLYNLGLDKPPPPPKDPASMLAHDIKNTGNAERLSKTTNEERRALLGCYLLSSVSCYTLAKGNPLLWTAHSEDCLRTLEHEKEYDSDALLVQLVKLRLLYTRISDGFGTDGVLTAPVAFYLKSFEGQLQNFKNNIPPELSNNETLLLELYATERSVYEIGMAHDHNIFQGKETRRVECLWACANATNSWINIFLSIPAADYPGFSA